MKLFINEKLGEISLKIDRAEATTRVLVIAHGAGAGMMHPFLSGLAAELILGGTTCVRFNFPYMEQGRKAPGSQKDALFTWKAVTQKVAALFPKADLFLSGKSYGGRMASHLVAEDTEMKPKGIIYFGFPLHAPGKDSKDRASHLPTIEVPQLFLQGSKDKLANIDLISEVTRELELAHLETIIDADHSFNVPKKVGITQEEMLSKLAQKASQWMDHIALRS